MSERELEDFSCAEESRQEYRQSGEDGTDVVLSGHPHHASLHTAVSPVFDSAYGLADQAVHGF